MSSIKALHLQNFGLYIIILLLATLIFILALGPGVYSFDHIIFSHLIYEGFSILCHQDPGRSFLISGSPMAVCSRCISIYGAFLIGWILLPLLSLIKISLKSKSTWLITMILLNLMDVIGNYFNIWTNTPITRVVLGSLLGISVATLFNDEFNLIKNRN